MIFKYPRLLLPFFIKAVFEVLVLTVLFYSPRPPLSIVFAQPIKSFFGANFLHYPYNFNLLPPLFSYGQIFVMITVGTIMYGMAMGMVYQAHSEGGDVKIFGNLNRAIRRYFALTGIWLIIFVLSLLISKIFPVIIKKLMQPTPLAISLLQVAAYIGVVLVLLAESFFIYAYPSVIIERKGIFGAVKRSFGIITRLFLTTIILVFVPRFFEFLYMFVKQKQQGLMNLTVPEITLFILVGGIILSFAVDSLVFLSTANLFILKHETEKEK